MKFTMYLAQVFTVLFALLSTSVLSSTAFGQQVDAGCAVKPDGTVCTIYNLNSGYGADGQIVGLKDYDIDRTEYMSFKNWLTNTGFLKKRQSPVVIDDWPDVCDVLNMEQHGFVVSGYCSSVYMAEEYPITDYPYESWATNLLNAVAAYDRGAVFNLSNGPSGGEFDEPDSVAVAAALNKEIILVGAPNTFADAPIDQKYQVLTSRLLDGYGELVHGEGSLTVNEPVVCLATSWRDPNNQVKYIATFWVNNISSGTEASARMEKGSYSTPMLTGIVQRISDVVMLRDNPTPGTLIKTVFDYIFSSCDRDTDDFERHPGATSYYGPWSPTRGYGIFSAWKAMIYAYGFGELKALDSEKCPYIAENENPPTEFSDDFELRGDLFVPIHQTFVVSPMASIDVVVASGQEGPEDLGNYNGLPEIRVGGLMEVNTSRNGGVNASLTIDAGGRCNVNAGGEVTIGIGQVLHVYDGGTLDLKEGGKVIIEEGGTLILEDGGEIIANGVLSLLVQGQFTLAGTLTLAEGSLTAFGPTSTIDLVSDLVIPPGATLMHSYGSVLTADTTDASGLNDTTKVEIICEGILQAMGDSNEDVIYKCKTAGAGNWGGISLLTTGTTGSYLNFVEIRDADIAIDVGGTAPATLWNLTITDCTTGVKITDRDDISISGSIRGEIANCTKGIELDQSDVIVSTMKFHDNDNGIHCTQSNPSVRNCLIYGNNVGVRTIDAASTPDLGTIADAGNNDFEVSGTTNNWHIVAADPIATIYAQYNCWGDTIEDKLAPGSGTIIFDPIAPTCEGSGPQQVAQRDEPDEAPEIPPTTYLSQNRPNPFNPTTTIRFGLGQQSQITLRVYDVAGRLVRELANEQLGAGQHERSWDGTDSNGNAVATGIYFYRLTAGQFTETKKMILLK